MNNMIFYYRKNRFRWFFIWLLLVGGGCSVSAYVYGISFAVKIIGTVVSAPSCEINGNAPININFGDELLITNIDGEQNYIKKIEFSLSCTGDPRTMRLQFNGFAPLFDSNVLRTSDLNLGVKFLKQDYSQLNLNEWLYFDYLYGVPTIYAVPVKNTLVEPLSGQFTASAVLLIESA